MATHTYPGGWWLEEEAMVLTVVEVLQEQAEETERASKRKG